MVMFVQLDFRQIFGMYWHCFSVVLGSRTEREQNERGLWGKGFGVCECNASTFESWVLGFGIFSSWRWRPISLVVSCKSISQVSGWETQISVGLVDIYGSTPKEEEALH